MEYQSLYRKYRPKNFDEVVGQEVTQKILKNALQNQKISHAYLFAGPRGTGKTSIAKIMAKTVNCELPKNGNCCDKCASCNIANSKDSVDIIEIDAASNNGVDEIRELRNKVSLVPTSLKYKVYIIDEVHMLTTGAFNALLKTLEEPPKHIIFILATTELHKVPSTILSRCQTLEFKKISEEALISRLKEICIKENILIDDESLKEIAKYSDGGMRDAIGILEKVSLYASDKITADDVRKINSNISKLQAKELTTNIIEKEVKYVLAKINEYYKEGVDLRRIVEEIILNIRDIIFEEEPKEKRNLIKLIDILNETRNKMINSTMPKVLLEIAIIEYCTEATKPEIIQEVKTEKIEIHKENRTNVLKEDDDIHKNLKDLRVSNTLTAANKEIIKEAREKWQELQNQAFNTEFGAYARILFDDAVPVAASKEYMIITFKVEGLARQCNEALQKMEKLIEKTLKCSYRLIFITEIEWKTYIEEYKKNKDKFIYIKEDQAEEKKVENPEKTTLKDKAKELFGEI